MGLPLCKHEDTHKSPGEDVDMEFEWAVSRTSVDHNVIGACWGSNSRTYYWKPAVREAVNLTIQVWLAQG